MKFNLIVLIFLCISCSLSALIYLGNTSTDQYDVDSINNPYGEYGSTFSPLSINNPYGKYGSPYSDYSAKNPYASHPPQLYDEDGNYRGNLSANIYDPNSIANPYGKYGNPYAPDSINNPYGAGNPYLPPLHIYGE